MPKVVAPPPPPSKKRVRFEDGHDGGGTVSKTHKRDVKDATPSIRVLKRQLNEQAKQIEYLTSVVAENERLLGAALTAAPMPAALPPAVPSAARRGLPSAARGEMPFETRCELRDRIEQLCQADVVKVVEIAGGAEFDLESLESERLWRLHDVCEDARAVAIASRRRRPRQPRGRAWAEKVEEASAITERRLVELRAVRAALATAPSDAETSDAAGESMADEHDLLLAWEDESSRAEEETEAAGADALLEALHGVGMEDEWD